MDGACLELAGKIPADTSPLAGSDEPALIRRAQGGDRTAFDVLVRRYDREVLRLALKVVGSPDEAADLYQEAFLKVYRSLSRFRFESTFSTWLYRVVMNVCLDHLRRQKSRSEVQPPEGEEGQPEFFHTVADDKPGLNPEQTLRAKEINRRIGAALKRLSPRERMVFELKHFHGLKLRTVGEILHTTEDTAKNTLFRATQKLRGALAMMR